jgi:hypothetical protein
MRLLGTSYVSPTTGVITYNEESTINDGNSQIQLSGTSTKDSQIVWHDLTKMFGEGYEPTTIEDFYSRIPEGIDVNAYNEGEVVNMNLGAIKSVGFNAWDEQWELGKLNSRGEPYADNTLIRSKNFTRVIPNETYYFHGTFGYGIYFYDADKNYVKTLYVNNNKLQIPSNAMYLKFNFPTDYGTTYKNDIIVTLVHSGWKQDTDAGYQPYWEDTLPLPIIRKYFPDGMKLAGTAHDEIRFNKTSGKWEYSKGKIKSVDLGSLYYNLDSRFDNAQFYATSSAINNNIRCGRYVTIEGGWDTNKDKTITRTSDGNILIVDTAYTDAASFNAAMQGVMLYYESNDWEWVELDAEDQNFRDYYNVADFGTEQAISSTPSAPFSADIIYQFNAVDMIREHEAEITELQKVIATMQAQLTSLINGGQ